MNNIVQMQELEAIHDGGNKELCLLLSKSPSHAHMVPQVATSQQVHNQVQGFSILKSIVHIHNKRMLQLAQQLPLVHYRVNTLFSDDFSL